MSALAQLNWWTPASASFLAFVTTVHCAMMVLLKHRQPGGRLTLRLLPSVALTFSPWFLATPAWLATALASHVVWLSLPGNGSRQRSQSSNMTVRADMRRPAVSPPTTGARPRAVEGFAPVPVLDVLSETKEIRTLRLARPDGFDFLPGQFLMLRVDLDGKQLARCYSISSPPAAKGYLEISVRRQGQVSNFLHATVTPGMSLSIRGPQGSFVYPNGSRPIVLLAGGIGITPLISMARHAMSAEPTRPVTLVLSARSVDALPFIDELDLLARRHPRFRLVVAVSGGTDRPGYFSGRIDRSLLEAAVEHVGESVYMICGPLPMIDEMRRILDTCGVPSTQVRFERFESAIAEAGRLVDAAVPDGTASSRRVTLRRRGCELEVRGGQSILEAADDAGEELPSMCRAGVCGSCRTKLLEGKVSGEFDAIDEGERASGFVLTCVARPVTDCVLDA